MKARILYIEDNEQNFYLVSFILRSRGHEVLRAKDGKEGVDEAMKGRFDIILLDIQLPVMDGYAVARALRQSPALQRTPIVALTSYAMAGDREKALGAGCSGYLEKPINPSTFASQIEGYLPVERQGD
ncbi:MAG: response regulator [Polyangia bacterium]|jgi:CheY-like chemotaxis protein|nr:response regulator [Polyangia bacterium]